MLPYAWGRRCLYLITNKKKQESLGSKFSAIVDNNEDVAKHVEMLKVMKLRWWLSFSIKNKVISKYSYISVVI